MDSALNLARTQFAVTTVFHMIWIILSIGLSSFILLMEVLWLKTGDQSYYQHARFWAKIFIIAFGIGVASGIPLEFQFGTNWSQFASKSGEVVGNLLAFEAAIAFALEAAFLAIFFFGWERVGKKLHLFSSIMVVLGATLSAFWIMSANSWMQTPAGFTVEPGGFLTIRDYWKVVFNPDLPIAFIHIWVACVETAAFFIGGICAWYILRNQNTAFFLKAFKVAVIIGIVLAPLQVLLGDTSGLTVIDHQPVKAAAMEGNWVTNQEGQGARWVVVAWPDEKDQKNAWEITVPNVLSLLSTHTLTGRVQGLRDFPVEDQPPVALPFYGFRIMVILGIAMVLLALLTIWFWVRKRLRPETAARNRLLFNIWLWMLPAGFIATECGWIVREVGRQPWIIFGVLRTGSGLSPVGSPAIATSLILFSVIYAVLFGLFIYFLRRVLQRGPEIVSLPYGREKEPRK